MSHPKTLVLPIFSALFASATLVQGAVRIALETEKIFRQYASGTEFRAGEFRINMDDGIGWYLSGCEDAEYFSPSLFCPDGATAFVGFGNPDPDRPYAGPYFMQTAITPAVIIEPRREDRVFLRAAPATKLPRPLAGFTDTSYSIYYNISPGSIAIREYTVSRYRYERTYLDISGGKTMDSEIVPGVYHFSFPRLGYPTLEVALPTVHYPIPEGYRSIGKVKQGVLFTSPSKFAVDGFTRLDVNQIRTISWQGFTRTLVYPGVDNLYFSVRHLTDPDDPRSPVNYYDDNNIPASIFPNVTSGADPRVLLANPLVSSFTLPPFIKVGTNGVVELELVRNLTTNGVSYDVSNRRFQIPVSFVDQYKEYALKYFGKGKKKIGFYDDFDGDKFNNMEEWVLNSRANDATSLPKLLNPRLVDADNSVNPPVPQYFGFVKNNRGLIPVVEFSNLERSTDGGKTWKLMVTDADWEVIDTGDEIGIKSKRTGTNAFGVTVPIAPPGTASHYYRISIALAP